MPEAPTLLALPQDVLLAVLQQPGIGPLELCRVELSCRFLRKLVDNSIWRQAFLQFRHCNALREPEDWKQEYARRDSWSRGWRQMLSGQPQSTTPHQLRLSMACQSSAPQKLFNEKCNASL